LLTLADTLKTKFGDVVDCIFEVECSVGGFLILKQIIQGLPELADQNNTVKSLSSGKIFKKIHPH
jgi:hypothetical protein